MFKSNTTGFTPITGKQVEDVLALLAKAQAPLDDSTVLSTRDRAGYVKLRRGAQQVIPTIAALATKYGYEMPSLPISDMTSKIEQAQLLRRVLGAVTVFQKVLKDAILAAEGESWETATATYAMLRRASKNRPEIAIELSPVAEWFRRAHRGAPSSASSAAATTSTAPAPTA